MRARNKKSDYGFSFVLLGLILGFFMGSGIVYWYSNRQNDSSFAYNLWDYFSGLFQGSENTSTYVIAANDPPTPDTQVTKPAGAQVIMAHTLLPLQSQSDSLLNDHRAIDDSTAFAEKIALPDSAPAPDELLTDFENPAPESELLEEPEEPISQPIRIAQDQLLQIRAYSLPSKRPGENKSEAISQLESLLGNHPQRPGTENMMLVEFWTSPFNFRGYKMSHNKLVVYGLDQVEAFSLHSDGENIFIKYFDAFYPVKPTMDYKAFSSADAPPLFQ